MTVVAPKGGYNFAEKRQYRRYVWNTIAGTPFIDPKRARVMLMPSLEGDEIDVAKAKGFRVSNMHVVDASPAVIATLRRRDYGAFTGYGRLAADACRHAATQGVKLNAANFDFTGCVGGVSDQIAGITESGVFGGDCVIGVTVQRGREVASDFTGVCRWGAYCSSPEWRQTLAGRHIGIQPNEADLGRMSVVLAELELGLNCRGCVVKSGAYKSNRVTMLWMVAAFQRKYGPPTVLRRMIGWGE